MYKTGELRLVMLPLMYTLCDLPAGALLKNMWRVYQQTVTIGSGQLTLSTRSEIKQLLDEGCVLVMVWCQSTHRIVSHLRVQFDPGTVSSVLLVEEVSIGNVVDAPSKINLWPWMRQAVLCGLRNHWLYNECFVCTDAEHKQTGQAYRWTHLQYRQVGPLGTLAIYQLAPNGVLRLVR